jgi:hypothetical protein
MPLSPIRRLSHPALRILRTMIRHMCETPQRYLTPPGLPTLQRPLLISLADKLSQCLDVWTVSGARNVCFRLLPPCSMHCTIYHHRKRHISLPLVSHSVYIQ